MITSREVYNTGPARHLEEIKEAYGATRTPFSLFLADGTFIFQNEAALDFNELVFGKRVIGSWADPYFKNFPASVEWQDKTGRCLKTRSAQRWTAAYTLYGRPHQVIHRDCSITPFFDGQKEPTHFLGEILDITGLVEAKEQLKIKKNQMDIVAHTVRHDLQDGLVTLVLAADLINKSFNKTQLEEPGLAQVKTMVRAGVERQTVVLKAMKEWLDMIGQKEVKKEQVDLKQIVDTLKNNNSYPGEIKVGDLPVVEASERQLVLLLDNLFRNGLECNDKPERWAKAYAQEGALIIEDNGNGFPLEKFDTLCHSFCGLYHNKAGSGGDGLAIAKSVCDNHGFDFKAESRIGIGSRYIIQYQQR